LIVIAFQVQIGQRGNARLSFPAMSEDSFRCHEQHVGMAEPGERVEIIPLAPRCKVTAAHLNDLERQEGV
jgi:hypothetical protein